MEKHILYSFPLRLGRSGIGMTAWNQVNSLAQAGARVTVMTASCELPFASDRVKVVETLKIGGIKVPIRAIGLDAAHRLHDKIVARALRSMAEGVDAFHGWPLSSSATIDAAHDKGIATFLERPNTHTRFGFSVVAEAYSRLNLAVPPNNTHHTDRRHLLREEEEYRKTDYLLCPSDFVKRTFLDNGIPEAKLLRHRYGYNPKKFYFMDQRAESFTLLFLGRGEPRKGLHYALEAWSRSKASKVGRFFITGAVEPGYAGYLERYASLPGVEYTGFMSDPNKLLNASHALVLPSIEEGSALVTYEAMACGCVPLVSTASGAPCEHGKSGFFHEPGDVDALAGHIDLIAFDGGRREDASRKALEAAASLSWEESARILIGLYGKGR